MEITNGGLVDDILPAQKKAGRLSFLASGARNKKGWLTLALFFLLILASIILLFYVFGLFKEFSSPAQPSPTPTNEATTSGKRVPSGLAIDPDFLKLEEDLGELEKDLNAVDLSEPKLSPPIIELNVNFER